MIFFFVQRAGAREDSKNMLLPGIRGSLDTSRPKKIGLPQRRLEGGVQNARPGQ